MTQTVSEGSSIWSHVSAVMLVTFCLYYWINWQKEKERGIHLLCTIWIVIMSFLSFINGSYQYLQLTLLWPSLFEMSYLLGKYHRGFEKKIKNVFYILAIYGSYVFLLTRNNVTNQTNTIYFAFLTLPWLLTINNRKLKILFMIVFSLFALYSMKRSVLLSIALSWGFFILDALRGKSNKVSAMILIAMLFGLLSYTFLSVNNRLGGQLEERINREETDTGKNRLAIWTITTQMIEDSSIDQLIIGHGQWGVKRNSLLNISAHNDLLEVIYDYGLLIFLLYLLLWIYIIKTCYILYKFKSLFFLPYAVSTSIFVVVSNVGHLILYATYFNYLVIFWGYIEAYKETNSHPEPSINNENKRQSCHLFGYGSNNLGLFG